MTSATLEKEFHVETSDKMGTAGQLTTLLSSDGKYNIKAIWGSSSSGKGHFYFIPENFTKAKEYLSSSNEFKNYKEEEVVVALVEDKPGIAAKWTNSLAKANIDIKWFYSTYYNGKPALVFSCSDNKKALTIFNQ